MFLSQVIESLQNQKIRFAIVGGYALAIHGIVRATMDVDLVIGLTEAELQKAEAAMKAIGLTSRIPVTSREISQFRQEYIEKRNLLAWSFVDFANASRQVDLLIVKSIDDIEVEKRSFGGRSVGVASLRSLLEMKMAANRPEDQLDIQRIKEKLDEA